MKLLVVEDEERLAEQIAAILRSAGYAVDTSHNGEEAHYLGSTAEYDAIILDIGLPKMNGLDVLKQWRSEGSKTPVLLLTARDSWSEKVVGLDAGADDYLSKPFHGEELLARVRALIRRAAGNPMAVLKTRDIELDTRSGKVTRSGELIPFTAWEFKMLSYLLHHKGRIVSRLELVEHLYEQEPEGEFNSIDQFLKRIRRKLGSMDVIETVRGLGFRIPEDV
jgi:two-component system, OmpR family, response regulator